MEKKVLVMTFLDNAAKDFNLRLENPKEGLDMSDVTPVMDTIISSGVFPSEGSLVSNKKAEVIVTTTEVLFDKEA